MEYSFINLKKHKKFLLVIVLILSLTFAMSGFGESCLAAQEIAAVNVLDYGAVQDNPNIDNIAAIQNAINDVTDSATVSIYFPAGVYYISPSATNYIKIKSGLHIIGDKGTIIKVKNNAGNYRTIFGPSNASDYIENVSFRNITIDQNGAKNMTCNVTTDSDYCQFIFWVDKGDNFVFENVNCDSYCGINAFAFGESTKRVSVRNCYFKFVRTGSVKGYDNSALCVGGREQSIVNNIFCADVSQPAGTAIETRYDAGSVLGNITDGFLTGIKIVSSGAQEVSGKGESDITVAGNAIKEANTGIDLRSYTGQKLSNISICDNRIEVLNVAYNEDYNFGIAMQKDELFKGSYENINILNNNISFQKELSERINMKEAKCYGIGISAYGKMERINIMNNVVLNAPLTGIKIGLRENNNICSGICVKGNYIANSGHYKYAMGQNYRAAVYLTGILDGVSVEKNSIYDDSEIFSGHQSIVTCGNRFKNVSVMDNEISSTQGGYYFHIPSSTLNIETGAKINFHNVSELPTEDKVTLRMNDIVYVEDDGAYSVIESGTTGTLNGVVAHTGKGNNIALVNDSSGICVGDYIVIEGTDGPYRILKVAGNELLLCRRCNVSLIGASVSYKKPEYARINEEDAEYSYDE